MMGFFHNHIKVCIIAVVIVILLLAGVVIFICVQNMKKAKSNAPKKSKTSYPLLENNIVRSIKENQNIECAVLNFILLQSSNNNVFIGTKNGDYYICFTRCDEINKFLKDWFGILKLHQNGQMTENSYKNFIKNKLYEYALTEEERKD